MNRFIPLSENPHPRRRRALRAMAALLPALVTASAFAASSDPQTAFQPLIDFICKVQALLSGPVGFAVGVLIIAIGGLMIAFGGKRSISFIVWGAIGIVVAISAPKLLLLIAPNATNTCSTSSGTASAPTSQTSVPLTAEAMSAAFTNYLRGA